MAASFADVPRDTLAGMLNTVGDVLDWPRRPLFRLGQGLRQVTGNQAFGALPFALTGLAALGGPLGLLGMGAGLGGIEALSQFSGRSSPSPTLKDLLGLEEEAPWGAELTADMLANPLMAPLMLAGAYKGGRAAHRALRGETPVARATPMERLQWRDPWAVPESVAAGEPWPLKKFGREGKFGVKPGIRRDLMDPPTFDAPGWEQKLAQLDESTFETELAKAMGLSDTGIGTDTVLRPSMGTRVHGNRLPYLEQSPTFRALSKEEQARVLGLSGRGLKATDLAPVPKQPRNWRDLPPEHRNDIRLTEQSLMDQPPLPIQTESLFPTGGMRVGDLNMREFPEAYTRAASDLSKTKLTAPGQTHFEMPPNMPPLSPVEMRDLGWAEWYRRQDKFVNPLTEAHKHTNVPMEAFKRKPSPGRFGEEMFPLGAKEYGQVLPNVSSPAIEGSQDLRAMLQQAVRGERPALPQVQPRGEIMQPPVPAEPNDLRSMLRQSLETRNPEVWSDEAEALMAKLLGAGRTERGFGSPSLPGAKTVLEAPGGRVTKLDVPMEVGGKPPKEFGVMTDEEVRKHVAKELKQLGVKMPSKDELLMKEFIKGDVPLRTVSEHVEAGLQGKRLPVPGVPKPTAAPAPVAGPELTVLRDAKPRTLDELADAVEAAGVEFRTKYPLVGGQPPMVQARYDLIDQVIQQMESMGLKAHQVVGQRLVKGVQVPIYQPTDTLMQLLQIMTKAILGV